MGLFDPGWKKVQAQAPAWFAAAITDWDENVVAWLKSRDVPGNGFDLCRSYIYGRIATALQSASGDWAPDAANFAAIQTRNAEKVMPRQFNGVLLNIINTLWGDALFRAAFKGAAPTSEPRDGQLAETAVVLRGAADNTLALAGLLCSVTNSEVSLKSIRTKGRGSGAVLVIDYFEYQTIGLSKDRTLFVSIADGPPPATDTRTYERLGRLPAFGAGM